jgi:hypothetical protein
VGCDRGSGVGRGVGRGVAGTPSTVTGSVELSPRTHRGSGLALDIRTTSFQRPADGTVTLRPGTSEGVSSTGTWTEREPSVTLASQLSPAPAIHESAWTYTVSGPDGWMTRVSQTFAWMTQVVAATLPDTTSATTVAPSRPRTRLPMEERTF